MPNLDGSGPQGQGPLTGRGLGRCRSQGGAVASRPRFGRGAGRGPGRGFGRGRFGYQAATTTNNTSSLRDELEAIKKRLNELEK